MQYTKVPSLTGLLAEQIHTIRAGFPAIEGINRLYLFGSCARGAATYRSDIDLLLVQNDLPRFARVVELRDEVERRFAEQKDPDALRRPLQTQIQIIAHAAEARFVQENAPTVLLRDFTKEKK